MVITIAGWPWLRKASGVPGGKVGRREEQRCGQVRSKPKTVSRIAIGAPPCSDAYFDAGIKLSNMVLVLFGP